MFVTAAFPKLKIPTPALLLLHSVRVTSVASKGCGFKIILASPLSHNVDDGSLTTTEIFVGPVYWKLVGLAIGVPLHVM